MIRFTSSTETRLVVVGVEDTGEGQGSGLITELWWVTKLERDVEGSASAVPPSHGPVPGVGILGRASTENRFLRRIKMAYHGMNMVRCLVGDVVRIFMRDTFSPVGLSLGSLYQTRGLGSEACTIIQAGPHL